jgi:Mat/Ecp fimbriae major subunit
MTNKFYSAVLAGTALLAVSLGATSANAATATANATANIVQPVTIAEDVALSFGTIVPAAAPGSVTVSTAGGRTCTTVTCVATGPAHAAGQFTVTGTAGMAVNYSVSGPLSLTNGANPPMAVSALTTSGTGTGTLTGGTLVFTVGATLAVGANQPAGVYSGTYTATANYN